MLRHTIEDIFSRANFMLNVGDIVDARNRIHWINYRALREQVELFISSHTSPRPYAYASDEMVRFVKKVVINIDTVSLNAGDIDHALVQYQAVQQPPYVEPLFRRRTS